MIKVTEEKVRDSFLRDIKDHTVKIIKEDGLYRHVRCKKEETTCYWFDVITWPGLLAYHGDMGSFMFSRVEDMFTFFRGEKLEINTGYWGEKVVSQSIFGNGMREFNLERYKQEVISNAKYFLDLEEDQELPQDAMDELWPVLCVEDEYEAISAIRNNLPDRFQFDDFGSGSYQKTYHYVWACFAIVWAIQQYDKLKEEIKNDKT